MIDPKTLHATLKTCDLLTLGKLKEAAVVMAILEAVCRPEPGLISPRLAAYVRSRKPSEISQRISNILLDGCCFQVELESNQEAILTDLAQTGENPFDARTFFQSKVVQAKWKMMASLSAGEVEA